MQWLGVRKASDRRRCAIYVPFISRKRAESQSQQREKYRVKFKNISRGEEVQRHNGLRLKIQHALHQRYSPALGKEGWAEVTFWVIFAGVLLIRGQQLTVRIVLTELRKLFVCILFFSITVCFGVVDFIRAVISIGILEEWLPVLVLVRCKFTRAIITKRRDKRKFLELIFLKKPKRQFSFSHREEKKG